MIAEEYKKFLDRLFEMLSALNIDISNCTLDHIAFRTANEEDFQKYKEEFSKMGRLTKEHYFSGNMICIFKLNEPLQYKNYTIPAIEYIGPHEQKKYKTGFEHAEFIIRESFDEFIVKYPSLNWDKSATDRDQYPMLKLPLDEGIQVKFRHDSMLD